MEPSLQGAPHSDASSRHLRIPATLPCPSEGADADHNGLTGASEGHAADAPVQATAAIPHRRNLHGALALVEGQVNIVHHNQATDEYDLHNQENGGVGTQLGYDVTAAAQPPAPLVPGTKGAGGWAAALPVLG